MSQKLPSSRLARLFGRGQDTKNRGKSKTKKDSAIASSIMPGMTSTSIAGTSLTCGESSQPETSSILANVEPQSSKQAPSISRPASSVHQPVSTVSPEHPTPTASPALTATSDTVASEPSSLPERLWDRAYDELKDKESDLVDAYEKILSRELKEGNSSSLTSGLCENAIEQKNLMTRRSQMKELVQAGLKKTEGEDKVKQIIGRAMKGVHSVKHVIDSALNSVPQAAIAWAGVCCALQVSLLP
jgi:N-terminal domain of NWD NACHT-NTPase